MMAKPTISILTGAEFYGVNAALMAFCIKFRHRLFGGSASAFFLLFFGFQLGIQTDSLAFSPTYEAGFESQIYHAPVEPLYFPILNLGIRFQSEDVDRGGSTEPEYRGDLLFRISPTDPRAFAATSRNLYWGDRDRNSSTPLRFTFGRRLIGWTRLDTLWSLGQIEPLDQWDRLRPSLQGLTGVFAYTETEKFNFRLFLSGLFLPEINPNVVLENQQFVRTHPQSITSAPQTFTLLDQSLRANYFLNLPAMGSILFRPAFTFSMETKREIPVSAKFVYGYLPLNYFPIALQGYTNISINEVVVNLRPRLLHHHVYNGELSYRFDDHLSFGGVALVDQPEGETIPDGEVATPLSVSTSWSPWVEYKGSSFSATLSHLWVFGGLEADVGPPELRSDTSSRFSSRLLYRNATLLQIKKHLMPGTLHDPVIFFKYIHEYSIKGDWFAMDLHYSIHRDLRVFAGGDILSSYRDVSPDRGAEFLADMRPLGRVRLGVTYEL
ncbi:MAG: hypothetical protein KGP28_09150 [Bdellovibrionales bacterium]|nr:hypothetical protein [Bdellovibrionales bacterium]